jgi:ribosome biogenesis protein BMS1
LEYEKSFRISATGTVLGINSQVNIQKKLKLVGYPENIYKNTCFIKEMFRSDIEASKFIGAKIKTVSNIRGVIKKVKGKNGLVRATFEDQLRISDIVFLR